MADRRERKIRMDFGAIRTMRSGLEITDPDIGGFKSHLALAANGSINNALAL